MSKTLDTLEGPRASKTTGPYDSINVYGRDIKSGEIGEIASGQRGILDQLDPYQAPMRSPSPIEFKEPIMAPIRKDYSPRQRSSAESFLDEQLHRISEPYEKRERLQYLQNQEGLAYTNLQSRFDAQASQAVQSLEQTKQSLINSYRQIPDSIPNPNARVDISTGLIDSEIPNPQKELAFADLQRRLSDIDLKQRNLSTRENATLTQIDPREFPELARTKEDLFRLEDSLQDAFETEGSYSPDALARFDFDQQQSYYKRLDDTRKDSNRLLNVTDFTADPWTKDVNTKAAKGLESTISSEIEKAILDQLGPEALQSYLQGNKSISQRIMLRDLYGSSRIPVSKVPSLEGRPSTKSASLVAQARDNVIMPYALKGKDALDSFGATVLAPAMEIGQPLSIQQYRIPRESERIMLEREMVAQKILMEVGQDAYDTFTQLETPSSVKEFLRQVEMAHPNLFQFDEYQRFDNEIKDPILKNKALEGLIKSSQSVFDKAKAVNDLLLNNRLQGQIQAS